MSVLSPENYALCKKTFSFILSFTHLSSHCSLSVSDLNLTHSLCLCYCLPLPAPTTIHYLFSCCLYINHTFANLCPFLSPFLCLTPSSPLSTNLLSTLMDFTAGGHSVLAFKKQSELNACHFSL